MVYSLVYLRVWYMPPWLCTSGCGICFPGYVPQGVVYASLCMYLRVCNGVYASLCVPQGVTGVYLPMCTSGCNWWVYSRFTVGQFFSLRPSRFTVGQKGRPLRLELHKVVNVDNPSPTNGPQINILRYVRSSVIALLRNLS